jgi:hypothetical protein
MPLTKSHLGFADDRDADGWQLVDFVSITGASFEVIGNIGSDTASIMAARAVALAVAPGISAPQFDTYAYA